MRDRAIALAVSLIVTALVFSGPAMGQGVSKKSVYTVVRAFDMPPAALRVGPGMNAPAGECPRVFSIWRSVAGDRFVVYSSDTGMITVTGMEGALEKAFCISRVPGLRDFPEASDMTVSPQGKAYIVSSSGPSVTVADLASGSCRRFGLDGAYAASPFDASHTSFQGAAGIAIYDRAADATRIISITGFSPVSESKGFAMSFSGPSPGAPGDVRCERTAEGFTVMAAQSAGAPAVKVFSTTVTAPVSFARAIGESGGVIYSIVQVVRFDRLETIIYAVRRDGSFVSAAPVEYGRSLCAPVKIELSSSGRLLSLFGSRQGVFAGELVKKQVAE